MVNFRSTFHHLPEFSEFSNLLQNVDKYPKYLFHFSEQRYSLPFTSKVDLSASARKISNKNYPNLPNIIINLQIFLAP
jgi:hypothetical protein